MQKNTNAQANMEEKKKKKKKKKKNAWGKWFTIDNHNKMEEGKGKTNMHWWSLCQNIVENKKQKKKIDN